MKIIYSNNLWRSLLIVPRVCSKWNIYSGKSTREFVTLEPWPTPSIPLPQISATETPFQKCVANNTGLPVPESPGKGYSSSRRLPAFNTPHDTHIHKCRKAKCQASRAKRSEDPFLHPAPRTQSGHSKPRILGPWTPSLTSLKGHRFHSGRHKLRKPEAMAPNQCHLRRAWVSLQRSEALSLLPTPEQ